MKTFSGIALLFLVWVGGCIAAEDPVSDAELVKNLGDDDFAVRQQAQKKLSERGEAARNPLEKAKSSVNPEIQVRSQKLLAMLESGKEVDGLRIALSADQKAVKPGDEVSIKITLYNVSDKDLRVPVGFTECGNMIEAGVGLKLTVVEKDGKEGPPVSPTPLWSPFDPDKREIFFDKIPAQSCKVFTCLAKLSVDATKDDKGQAVKKPVLQTHLHGLVVPSFGTTRLAFNFQAKFFEKSFPASGQDEKNWNGEALSNAVSLEVQE